MILALLAGLASAGAWTRPAGGYYAKLGFDLYVAPEYVSPVTATPGASTGGTNGFRGEAIGAVVELGILDPEVWRVQVGVGVPLTIGHTQFAFGSAFGRTAGHTQVVRVGDVRITPQIALHPKLPLAAALEVKVPAYRNDTVCADNPYRVYCPRPGEGQVDYTPHALAGLASGDFFGELLAGWRIRTDQVIGAEAPVSPLGDGPVWAVTGGWDVSDVLLIARVEGNHVLGEDLVTPQAVRAGPAVLWTFDADRGLALEGRFAADVWARGTSRGLGGGVGLSARR
ncbi:MAG: hypothetical protein H0V89_00260 [Deltaproteobacteria bacterium]|nr:hypothetical protein [Deltaproteobacteria bacterium]